MDVRNRKVKQTHYTFKNLYFNSENNNFQLHFIKNIMPYTFNRYAQENVSKLLIGNKSDLTDKRQVSFEEGQ